MAELYKTVSSYQLETIIVRLLQNGLINIMGQETQYREEQKVLFAGVRGTAVKILNRVERTDSYLDKLIDAEFRSSEFNDLDKSLLMEIVHGVLRWQSKLDWVLNGFFPGSFSKAEVTVRNTLRAALYQILFLIKFRTMQR